MKEDTPTSPSRNDALVDIERGERRKELNFKLDSGVMKKEGVECGYKSEARMGGFIGGKRAKTTRSYATALRTSRCRICAGKSSICDSSTLLRELEVT